MSDKTIPLMKRSMNGNIVGGVLKKASRDAIVAASYRDKASIAKEG